MRNTAATPSPPATSSSPGRPPEARQARGKRAGGFKSRWFDALGRVLRFGRPRSPVAPLPATVTVPVPVQEPAADLAAPTSSLDRLYELAPRLRRAWSADTSVLPQPWSAQRPALGQSAATVCVVQDALGGEIIESRLVLADGCAVSHFANVIEGLVVDLTQTEVERATRVDEPENTHPGFASMRAYVLAQPGAQAAYAALDSRLAEVTNGHAQPRPRRSGEASRDEAAETVED